MSGSKSTPALGTSIKLVRLNKHTKHRHSPRPVLPNFVAPPVCPTLSFDSISLAAAVARTATTWDTAPVELLDGLQLSALVELETLLQHGSDFALEPYFQLLADTARSQFAAKIGAGIAHLYMNALGYAWRANAACLSSSLNPHADFIYGGGNASGKGVVLAEAHGSFAKNANAKKIENAAKRKYIKQVKPFVANPSPFGKIIHGYSIAFGADPLATGGLLSVSETHIPKQRTRTSSPSTPRNGALAGATPTSLALATYRSNFILMGAMEVANWIDSLRMPDTSAREENDVNFLRLGFGAQTYLVATPSKSRQTLPPWRSKKFFGVQDWWQCVWSERLLLSRPPHFSFSCFAVEETAGGRFLNALSNAIRNGRESLEATMFLPTFEPVGFAISGIDRIAGSEAGEPDAYALFRDGLALLANPLRGVPREIVVWSPGKGIELGQ